MAASEWTLQRGYVSEVYPARGEKSPTAPKTYSLTVDAEFRRVISQATTAISRRHKSAIVLRMADNRTHTVREILLKIGFGQTRTPLAAMVDLAARLAQATDKRSKPSLLVVTVEERDEARRICIYAFPEESSYLLKTSSAQPTEAVLEHLSSFVLESRLRKVARFDGKAIKSHFMQGEVVDLQYGTGAKPVADYFIANFLDAEFALNDHKGTTLAASALKLAFQAADPAGKQKVMEAAISLMADGRRAWSLQKIATEFIPQELQSVFLGVTSNGETVNSKFMLNKDLLRERINYRVFQLKNGVWVSSPFSEVGKAVKIEEGRGGIRTLTARGEVQSEKVRSNAKRNQGD